MKLFAFCTDCHKELGHPSFEPLFVDYFDDRIGVTKCARGHENSVLLQSQKFEVLMESGANALAQGFTLEACSSFASAVERAVEFGLRVLCIAQAMPPETWANSFKVMARQSERQLGAFVVLHALAFGTPYIPNKKIVEDRNEIVHKGAIFNLERTSEFCELAYGEVVALMERLKEKFPKEVLQAVRQDMNERGAQAGGPINTTSTGTIFYCLASGEAPRTFKDAQANLQEAQQKFQAAAPFMNLLHRAILAETQRPDGTPKGVTS